MASASYTGHETGNTGQRGGRLFELEFEFESKRFDPMGLRGGDPRGSEG